MSSAVSTYPVHPGANGLLSSAELSTHYGPMSSHGTNPYEAYFGPMPYNPTDLRYADQYNSMHVLIEAYRGKNRFLGTKIVGLLLLPDEDGWQLSANHGLPIVHTTDKIWSWKKIMYDEAYLDRVPELAPTRYIASSSGQESATSKRWGLGFQFETGFYGTPEGRQDYVNIQMAIFLATQRSLHLMVLSALLGMREQSRTNAPTILGSERPTMDIIKAEVRNFAAFQKQAKGMERIVDEVLHAMHSQGVYPNTFVVNQAAKVWMGKNVENAEVYTDYQHAGPDALTVRHTNPENIRAYRGMAVKHAASYYRDGQRTPVDPLVQYKTIGDYMVLREKDKFITVFDADNDTMVELKWADYYKEGIVVNYSDADTSIQGIKDSKTDYKMTEQQWRDLRARVEADHPSSTTRSVAGVPETPKISPEALDAHLAATKDQLKSMLQEAKQSESEVAFVGNQFQNALGMMPDASQKLAHSLWVGQQIASRNIGALASGLNSVDALLSAKKKPTAEQQRATIGAVLAALPSQHPTYLQGGGIGALEKADQEQVLGFFLGKKASMHSNTESLAEAAKVYPTIAGTPDYATFVGELEASFRAAVGKGVRSLKRAAESGSVRDESSAYEYLKTTEKLTMEGVPALSKDNQNDLCESITKGITFCFEKRKGPSDTYASYLVNEDANIMVSAIELHVVAANPFAASSGSGSAAGSSSAVKGRGPGGPVRGIGPLDGKSGNKNLLLLRPWIEFVTGTAIVFKGGAETGITPIGNEAYMLGSDASTGRFTGHFTLYATVLIYEPKNILVMDDVFVRKYVCGMGVKPFTKERYEDVITNGYLPRMEGRPSIVVFQINDEYVDDLRRRLAIDMAGKFRGTNQGAIGEHFGCVEVCKDVEKFHNVETLGVQDVNTVCLRGHFEWIETDDDTGRSKLKRSINQGHLGPNLYDGCIRDLEGGRAVMREMGYAATVNLP